jgi:hypothetical protein
MIAVLKQCLDRIYDQVGSENKLTVRVLNPGGMAVMQVTHIPHLLNFHLTGMARPHQASSGDVNTTALAATSKKDSPTYASTAISAGKNRITTLT